MLRVLLDFVGYDGAFILGRLSNQREYDQDLTGMENVGYWFGILLIGLLLAGFGTAILLKVPNLHVGS